MAQRCTYCGRTRKQHKGKPCVDRIGLIKTLKGIKADGNGDIPMFDEIEYIDPNKDKCEECACSFGVHLVKCSKFRSPQEKCTCGPDYFDNFCPRHGNKPPDEKWKELNSRPESTQNDVGKSYKDLNQRPL